MKRGMVNSHSNKRISTWKDGPSTGAHIGGGRSSIVEPAEPNYYAEKSLDRANALLHNQNGGPLL